MPNRPSILRLTPSLFGLLAFFMLAFSTLDLHATGFKAGGELTVSEADSGDLYLTGGRVDVECDVQGDLLVAGGNVSVDGHVQEDLMISGGEIEVNGGVGDDLRAFGGTIRIDSDVEGDLLVFGGELVVAEGATVNGLLKVFGGEVRVDGDVKGNAHLSGGELEHRGTVGGDLRIRSGKAELAGRVDGKSNIAARQLMVREGASFGNDVRYWRKAGEMELASYIEDGDAILDPALENKVLGDLDWGVLLFGFTLFWIIYVLSAALILFLLNFFLTRTFKRAGIAMEHTTKSLGFGALYLFGLPIACMILLVTVIGAPIALVGGTLWGLSILFAHLLSATVITHWLKVRYNKAWDRIYLFLISLVIYIAIKGLAMIPILGWLFSIFIVLVSFGALLLARRAIFTNRPMVRL